MTLASFLSDLAMATLAVVAICGSFYLALEFFVLAPAQRKRDEAFATREFRVYPKDEDWTDWQWEDVA